MSSPSSAPAQVFPSSPSRGRPPPAQPRNPPRGLSFVDDTSNDDEPNLAGQLLGERFEILRPLGRGGMGVVWLAEDRVLRSVAAIKVLTSRRSHAKRRFADEIEILGNVRDPHLVSVLGAGEVHGLPYLAMEYLRGENLSRHLAEHGPLPWRDALDIGIQVARGLVVLHRAGVIHRDVKPSNLMLLESAAPGIFVKLIDLGVAKILPDHWRGQGEAAPRQATREGFAVGTTEYQPPEAGLVDADPQLDVYGLGATLYQLCTGQLPRRDGYRPLREHLPQHRIPADFEAVIASALDLDPEKRTASATTLLAALERVRDTHRAGTDEHLFDGRYELIRPLGAGGKAEVHLAHHHRAQRDVALKMLKPATRTPEERARLQREARALAAVRHPCIPTLYDAVSRDDLEYIVMEVARGERASLFTDPRNRLSQREVTEIGLQLVDALEALHAQGILHRDINNSNVLLEFPPGPERQRKPPRVTLIDLGQCELMPRWYDRAQRYPTPPRERQVLGSGAMEQFDWTAPEARRGQGWSPKSDVYSVAMLLFRLLTGHKPTAPKSDELLSPRKYIDDCDDFLCAALLGALNPDPAKRLDTAQLRERLDLAAEILRADESTPSMRASTPPSPSTPEAQPEPPRPTSRRVPLALVALLFLVALGLVIVLAAQRTPDPLTQDPAREVAASAEPETTPTLPPPAPLPTFHEALAAARPLLKRCAQSAGEPLFVELTVTRGDEALRDIAILNTGTAAECARAVLGALRFQPAAAEQINEEYSP